MNHLCCGVNVVGGDQFKVGYLVFEQKSGIVWVLLWDEELKVDKVTRKIAARNKDFVLIVPHSRSMHSRRTFCQQFGWNSSTIAHTPILNSFKG